MVWVMMETRRMSLKRAPLFPWRVDYGCCLFTTDKCKIRICSHRLPLSVALNFVIRIAKRFLDFRLSPFDPAHIQIDSTSRTCFLVIHSIATHKHYTIYVMNVICHGWIQHSVPRIQVSSIWHTLRTSHVMVSVARIQFESNGRPIRLLQNELCAESERNWKSLCDVCAAE